jgi:hypothetical protein
MHDENVRFDGAFATAFRRDARACDVAGNARSNHMTSKSLPGAIAAAALFTSSVCAQTLNFAGSSAGSQPKDFEFALTGNGKMGQWEVVEDATAQGGRALAQVSADRTDYRFPLAIYTPTMPSDIEATIRFKPVSGKVDRAGGIAVRLTDPNNYYLARANALENNVHFYRVVGGRRQQLAGANTKVSSGEWHTLTLRAEKDRLSASFDGKQLFMHTDRTFSSPGKVALWTKADSVTRFDELVITPLEAGR